VALVLALAEVGFADEMGSTGALLELDLYQRRIRSGTSPKIFPWGHVTLRIVFASRFNIQSPNVEEFS
jgi:hypothetical protein